MINRVYYNRTLNPDKEKRGSEVSKGSAIIKPIMLRQNTF